MRSWNVDGVSGRGFHNGNVGKEVSKFIWFERFESEKVVINGIHVGRFEIAIICIIVDRHVWSPFDDESGGLDEGLTLVFGQGFNPSDGCVRHGEDCPLLA